MFNRRQLIQSTIFGAAATGLSSLGTDSLQPPALAKTLKKGPLPPIKITDVKTMIGLFWFQNVLHRV